MMTSTILLDADTIKGYCVWVASTDVLDFSHIYARLYRKIREHDEAAHLQKYRFSFGLNVPYDSIDTLIIIDECLPLEGIPGRVRILSMTRLEARGYISSYPQLAETDFKVMKMIEKVLLKQPELSKAEKQLLADRESYRQDIRRTTGGKSE